ncbi:MAG: aldo/keto reductase [Gemmiger sp.]
MKKLGFGCMRLPLLENGEVDLAQFCQMVDLFLERGFTYFDTAHGYLDGKSEKALQAGLTSRYPRETYLLADKLTSPYFESEADIRPFFASQLEICGVDYFDYYLMHALNADNYKKFTACRAFEVAQQLKAEGKIRHVGFSFHDKAEVLDQILTEHPEVEFVQIQFNYADYDDPGIESFRCYQVCERHNKPVVVMEPVKGGGLADKLPPAGRLLLDELHGGSAASYAIRFAAGFDRVMMVLSGMSTLGQMEDNTAFMREFRPLTDAEHNTLTRVRAILRSQDAIPCTACRYCTAGCPMAIDIPALFACYNARQVYQDWNSEAYYEITTQNGGLASACVRCGQCEEACPQHLAIRELLGKVAETFE